MEPNYSDPEGSIDFTIQPTRSGPVLAAFLSIEMVLAILTNSFIVIYTLLHCKPLTKQSGVVLLFGLAATNLFLSVTLLLPITTAGAGEWMFGETVAQKEAICKLDGYLNMMKLLIRYDMLCLVSIDRFLCIVKPLVYKQYFKPKYAAIVMVASWLIIALVSTIPFYTSGFFFLDSIYVCHARMNVIFLTLIIVVIALIIGITSIWTFVFTRKFLKKHHDSVPQSKEQDNIYNKRVCKLFGIFSLMIMMQMVALTIAILKNIVNVVVDPDPKELSQFVFIFGSSLSIICIPAIQCYFRNDMWNDICRGAAAIGKALLCRACYKINE